MRQRTASRRRDPLAERELLDRSQRLARLVVANWPAIVEQRLQVGERLYGDAWTRRTTEELLQEVSAEAVDGAAWSLLAVQSLGELDGDAVATIGEMISRAVGASAESYAYIAAARAALRKAGR